MARFDEYAFSAQPGFDEPTMREAFAKAVPLKTVLIYCYDPRVRNIPEAVARHFGEVYPGEVLKDAQGHSVGSTTTLATVSVAAGRAVDGLRSITVAEYLFGIQNIVIVHHSNCGATSFSKDGFVNNFGHEHGTDISTCYDQGSVCITDYEKSLQYDVDLVRASVGVPKHVDVFGLFYDTDTGALTEVVRDLHQPA
ncbi:carbonic anhydrase [Pseudomonas sp. NPDC090202]|uniref:carbonic anhydrase n=1 Tax=unclassified Pseudomonas TaxID=196821 RepID=UPI0037F3664E